jgi:hypothetical protein
VGRGRQSCCLGTEIPWWNRKCETMHCHDATASSFAAKVRGKVFSHYHAVAVKRHNSMQNWLYDLPGRILCKQFPWCQRKRWACPWLCSSPVSPFSVSVSLDFMCMAHAFFLERLSNHCEGLRRTLFQDLYKTWCSSFVEFIAKSHRATYTTPNRMTQKISTSTEVCEILYTDSQDILVLTNDLPDRF